MIITKIRLQEESPMAGSTKSWPLPECDLHLNSAAGDNGYILKDVQGLEPPLLTQVVAGFDLNGQPVYDDIAEDRQLVLKIGLNLIHGRSFSSLRDDLYKFLSRSVVVSLMNESLVVCRAIGYISRVEAAHFTNKPEVQMTIECNTGEFVAPEAINIPLVDLNSGQPKISYDEGTAPTGFDLQFTVTASRAGFNILNHSRVRSFSSDPVSTKFQLAYPLIAGDIIMMSTRHKNKRVILSRSGIAYDLAGYINPGAVWPKLYSGVNTFDWDILLSWVNFTGANYVPRYWGV